MKIAFDVSPLNQTNSAHAVRGVGFYTQNLKDAYEKYFPENEYFFFEEKKEIPKDIDIIHYPYFDPFSFSNNYTTPKSTVVTIHDLTPLVLSKEFPVGIKGRLKWNFQKKMLKNLGGIITDSQSSKKDIGKLTRVSENKVKVTYLAAGEEFTVKTEEEKKLLKEKYYLPNKFLLYVGDVTPNKNLPRILRSAIRSNLPLVLVGKALVQQDFDRSNAWNRDRVIISDLVKDAKNITLLGFLPSNDLVTLYNCATAFIMPSLYEGFGLPILEAMSCGCPVITSREGSLPEVAGQSALYVDAHDEASITNGIEKLYNNNDLQKSLRESGLKQARMFSWKKTAEETLAFYLQVLRDN